jgi:hypothetical protein
LARADERGQERRWGPGACPFIIIRAEETFDGLERVMSRAAYDLQVRATVHSASCGHPGYVPDDYLEHLDGLGIETTITAAELCDIGTWERVDGGYRVLDWEAVEYALDGVRQRTGEDPKALAAERDHEARAWAHMATPIVVTPPCAVCGTPAQVHTAGFYDDAGFCRDCGVPYCYRHWQVSETGYGYCPRGHGKSLDPHW